MDNGASKGLAKLLGSRKKESVGMMRLSGKVREGIMVCFIRTARMNSERIFC